MEVCAIVELYIEKTILTTQNSNPQIESSTVGNLEMWDTSLYHLERLFYAFCELQKHIAMSSHRTAGRREVRRVRHRDAGLHGGQAIPHPSLGKMTWPFRPFQ